MELSCAPEPSSGIIIKALPNFEAILFVVKPSDLVIMNVLGLTKRDDNLHNAALACPEVYKMVSDLKRIPRASTLTESILVLYRSPFSFIADGSPGSISQGRCNGDGNKVQ